MWDYQNEASQIAMRRSSRDNETEKHPAMTGLDQSHGKGNAPAIALQPDLSAERTLYRSGGNRSANGAALSHSSLLQLQRTHGNQYISRMLQAAEREDGESSVTPDVEHTIERSRGGGQALDAGVRSTMGKAMNADFSAVRVHTDAQADGLNRSLQARAFTTGRDVYFRQGEYNPGSSSGRELLAHELTHVVQQGGSAVQSKNEEEKSEATCSGCAAKSPVGGLQTKLTLGAPNDVYEQEADSVANAYINWERQPVARDNTGSQVRRQESEEEKKEQMMQTKPDASRLSRQPEEEKEEEPLQAKSEVMDGNRNRITSGSSHVYTQQRETSEQLLSTTGSRVQRDPPEGTVTEAAPEEITVESIPRTRNVEWEVQFNSDIQNRVASRANAYALAIVGAYQHYAGWVRTHQPAEVDYSLFNTIVNAAVSAACAYLPGMNPLLKSAVQTAINAVRDAVKGAVRGGLAADSSWEDTYERLESQGANLVLGIVQAPWAQDFPGWLERYVPAEYQQVHSDYRDRMTAGATGGGGEGTTWNPSMIGGETNRWLTALGVPDPQDRTVPRTLLARLIAETRLAQVRQRATSGIYTVLPGMTTGEERMYWEDPRELEHRLGAEGLREAYSRLEPPRESR